MNYQALSKNVFNRNGYEAIPIRLEDMESIRIWRNAQIDVLRQKRELTAEDQANYYHNVIRPLFDRQEPDQLII